MAEGVTDEGIPVLHRSQAIGGVRLAGRLARRRRAYRSRRLVLDPRAHHDLAVHGFHVTAPVVPTAVVEELRAGCAAWLEQTAPLDGQFRSSYGSLHQPDGEAARRCVIDALLPALRPLLVPDALLRPSVFQVKPSSPASGLRLHQDRAMVDERRSFSLHAWVALTDVTLDDGPLVLLPGSHRFGAWTRIPSPRDPLERFQDVMEHHAVAVEARAGQVVWFDAALVHGSLVNRGGSTRIGVSAVVTHRSDAVAIAADPIPADRSRTAVHEVDPAGVARVAPPPLEDGPVIGMIERDDLRFGPTSLAAVARIHRALHAAPPGVALPAGATCRS